MEVAAKCLFPQKLGPNPSKMEVSVTLASHVDVLRLVTRSSPRTSAERSDHFRSLAVSPCFERTNKESVVIGMSG